MSKRTKKDMSYFERFVTDGNEKPASCSVTGRLGDYRRPTTRLLWRISAA